MKTKILICLFIIALGAAGLAQAANAASAQFTDFEGTWQADIDNSLNLNIPEEDVDAFRDFTITINTAESTLTMSLGEDIEEISTIEGVSAGKDNTLTFKMDGHDLVMKKFSPTAIAIVSGAEIFMFSKVE